MMLKCLVINRLWLRLMLLPLTLATAQGAITLPTPPERVTPPLFSPLPPPRDPGATPPPAASPAAPVVPDRTLRLTLDLNDGSRIIGVPVVSNLNLRAVFGTVKFDLDRLVSIQFTADPEKTTLVFQNNDKISGALNLEAVELTTCFGRAKIPLPVIRLIGIATGGKGRQGLVLHYAFDQEDQNLVRDLSGLGHDGKFIGAKWTSEGKRGGGCRLSENLDELMVGNHETLQLQNFTLAAWIKRARRDTPSNGSYGAGLFSYNSKGYGFGLNQNGTLYISGLAQHQSIPAAVTDTEFHHVAVTKDHQKAVFYLDGEPCGETTLTVQYEEFTALSIGAAGSRRGYPFNGTLDEVMIFNRPLPAEEIKQIYQENK